MRRHRQLFEKLIDFSTLHKAYKKALEGSGKTKEALSFCFHLEDQLILLQEELSNSAYSPKAYRYFRIYEPKERLISVAPFRDRIVHHAIVMMLEPIFEKTFVFHSYATRKNKGTHKAIFQAQTFLKRYPWFYKADIEKYFASIDHRILLQFVSRKVKDKKFMAIVEKIILNASHTGKGLPIGNLTSQFFANVYLNSFDHFIKEQMRIKGYLRYMDDFVLFAKDKREARVYRREIDDYLWEFLQLEINPASSFINQRSNGLRFLGTKIFPNYIRILPKNLNRIYRKIELKSKLVECGQLSEEKFIASLNSHWAFLCQYDTLALRRNWVMGKQR